MENYRKEFPHYPPLALTKRWIYGVWMIGNYYKRKNDYYGEYPPSYLQRIYSLFRDCSNVLHLFSGKVEKNDYYSHTTFDINEELNPDVVGDVINIETYFNANQFDLIIADPPYEKKDFEKYGFKPFNKRCVLKKIHTICSGYLVWLDLSIPIYSREQWNMIGTICLIVGTNRRVRIISIFEKAKNGKLHERRSGLFKYW